MTIVPHVHPEGTYAETLDDRRLGVEPFWFNPARDITLRSSGGMISSHPI